MKQFQNNSELTRKFANDSGIMLITAVWILAILSLLAIGLSRSLSVDLTLVNTMAQQLHARYAILSVPAYLFSQKLSADNSVQGESAAFWSAHYPCGFNLDTQEVDQFNHIAVGESSYFDLLLAKQSSGFGIQDAKAFFNVNMIDERNYVVLAHLFMLKTDLSESDAYDLALAVRDWIDEDNELSTTILGSGAEQPQYDEEANSLRVKNRAITMVEELMMIKGMTLDIFNNIKNDVIAYPAEKNNWLLFNLNMVSRDLLHAVARSFPNVSESTIVSTLEEIERFRKGEDGQYCTADDRSLTLRNPEQGIEERLSQSERVVFRNLQNVSDQKGSAVFYVRAKGGSTIGDYVKFADMILDVEQKQILNWKSY